MISDVLKNVFLQLMFTLSSRESYAFSPLKQTLIFSRTTKCSYFFCFLSHVKVSDVSDTQLRGKEKSKVSCHKPVIFIVTYSSSHTDVTV